MSQLNTTLTDEESRWVNECAGRLRLIQADAADTTPEKRREYLREELNRSLKEITPTDRRRYLAAVLARFPVAGQVAGTGAATVPAPPPLPVAETPDELFERFIHTVGALPEAKRAEFSKRLADAGLVGLDQDQLVQEVSEELRRTLNLPADQQPQLKRLAQLTVLLTDMLHRLNRAALEALRELAPQTQALDRPADFRSAAARFLTSDEEAAETQVRQAGGLPATLLAALKGDDKKRGLAAVFLRQYAQRFSPESIEDVVVGEGGGGFMGGVVGPSKAERCWTKYKNLAHDFCENPTLADRWIKESLGKMAEEYLRKLGESKPAAGR